MTAIGSVDEPDYAIFNANSAALDAFLVEYAGPDGMRFLSYPKLAGLQVIWEQYDAALREAFAFAIEPGDVVIDIGAHHGIVSLNYARLGAQVYAFEPNPINYAVLQGNRALNPTYRILAAQQALASSEGDLVFNFGKTSTTGALAIAQRDWKRTDQSSVVHAVTLQSIVERHGLHTVKLLKVDCEGEEYDLLFNTPAAVVQSAAFICAEAHPTQRYGPPVLEEFLSGIGYQVVSRPAAHGCVELFCRYEG